MNLLAVGFGDQRRTMRVPTIVGTVLCTGAICTVPSPTLLTPTIARPFIGSLHKPDTLLFSLIQHRAASLSTHRGQRSPIVQPYSPEHALFSPTKRKRVDTQYLVRILICEILVTTRLPQSCWFPSYSPALQCYPRRDVFGFIKPIHLALGQPLALSVTF